MDHGISCPSASRHCCRRRLLAQPQKRADLDPLQPADRIRLRVCHSLGDGLGTVYAQHVAGILAAIRPCHKPTAMPSEPTCQFLPQRQAWFVSIPRQHDALCFSEQITMRAQRLEPLVVRSKCRF